MVTARLSPLSRRCLFRQRLQDRIGVEALTLYRLATRRSYFPASYHALGAIFIHIPKCAGTSLGEALFGTGRPGHFEWRHYAAENPEAFRRYFKFAVVRDPVERFLSAHAYLIAGGKSAADRAAGQDIAAHGDAASFLRSGFRAGGWQDYVHFRPQVRFICDREGRLQVDLLARHETLAADCAAIGARLGRPARLERRNVTPGGRPGREALDPAALRVLAEAYRDDFAWLGYPEPDT
ncbi:sulfotransferase family 2 domain-containing protein [Pseudoroseicyclus sp. CXY001]|uniref:sulfotransferase family 2 domain-containing protein n=1 Tax=Pseudoroseicyclus sp. CXY001 TaxID=3242492 RepID=UPI003571442B